MTILNLIPGVAEAKLAIAGVIATILLGGGLYVWHDFHELHKLQAVNAVLISNNKVLQENVDTSNKNFATCTSASNSDQVTIANLLKERAETQDAILVLADRQKTNIDLVNAIHDRLINLEKIAANNGTLSADLRETIRGIEAGVAR
jgi:hypothetical protein